MHWINVPLLTIMIWSGLRIYWADTRDPYGFGIGLIGWHWFDFLPDAVNETLGLDRKLARGMAFHFTFGWFFALNGIAYGIYLWRTGLWRRLAPGRKALGDALIVVAHDLYLGRLIKRPLPEQGQYNAAQRITYALVLLMGLVALLTGFAIYKPTGLGLLTTLFGGYEVARTIHFFVTIGFIAFFVIHVLQVARSGWRNFYSMVTGFEKVDDPTTALPAEVGAVPDASVDLATYGGRTRRSVLTGVVAAAGAAFGWRWVQNRPLSNRIPDVLRQGHEFNEALWRPLSANRTAPTFARSASSMMRVNGRIGLESPIRLEGWQMTVLGPDGSELGTHTLDDIRALPKVEFTAEHKCVEGWSHIVTWGGARFSDLAALYADELSSGASSERPSDFVSLETPDGEYYVGIDIESMLNPQMLLAYELQGEPLTEEHGAPLRLATPNKYGIKCLKRIGTVQFTNDQPTDYWFERGYDWYAQL